ncbi:MAG: hypothetical protein LUC50_01455 [Ruminococcus sp.]|nr:hypothetical protein [Ruminococcus sp.]
MWKGTVTEWDGTMDTTWFSESKTSFTLTNAEELAGFSQLVNNGKVSEDVTVYLGNNIVINDTADFDDWSETPPSYKFTPIGTETYPFSGTFDGQGYTIYGLYQSVSSAYAGFFGNVSGTVQNVNLDHAYIVNSYGGTVYTGGLVGYMSGTIQNCMVSGSVSNTNTNSSTSTSVGPYVGGVCGISSTSSATISNCSSSCAISVTSTSTYNPVYAGGIAGSALGTISDASNSGSIVTNSSSTVYVGGIAGKSTNAISNVNNSGTLTVENSAASNKYVYAGGVSGYLNAATVSDAENSGAVTINKTSAALLYVGGGIGYATGAVTVSDVINSGAVTADTDSNAYAGGICGWAALSSSSNLFSRCCNTGVVYTGTTSVSGDGSYEKAVGGIIGYVNYYGSLELCSNYGSVTAEGIYSSVYAGGLIGLINSNGTSATPNTVTDSYNRGAVSATAPNNNYTYAGGIEGYFYNYSTSYYYQTIENVYNTSTVNASYTGGMVGGLSNTTYYPTLTNCYYLSKASQDIGNNSSVSKAYRYNETNMKKQTFVSQLGDSFYYVDGDYPILNMESGAVTASFSVSDLVLSEYDATAALELVTNYTGDVVWV